MKLNKNAFVVTVASLALAAIIAVPFKASSQVNVDIHLGDEHHHPHHFPHPEIDAAMAQLNEARKHLAIADHDYGGHRVQAIKAVDAALFQCNKAIEFANSHDR